MRHRKCVITFHRSEERITVAVSHDMLSALAFSYTINVLSSFATAQEKIAPHQCSYGAAATLKQAHDSLVNEFAVVEAA